MLSAATGEGDGATTTTFGRVQDWPAGTGAQVMLGDVHGDAAQPGAELRLAAKARQVLDRFEEGGLHQVFEVGRGPDDARDQPCTMTL